MQGKVKSKEKRRKREKRKEERREGVAIEQRRLAPVHGVRIGCARRVEAGRDSKAGVSKRLVHPTIHDKVDVYQHQHQREPFESSGHSGGSYLAVSSIQLSDRGNGPTHRFAQPQRTPLASSKREQSRSSARRSFPISSLSPFVSFSMRVRVHAFHFVPTVADSSCCRVVVIAISGRFAGDFIRGPQGA